MRKIEWNKKYTTIAVYACIVIFFSLVVLFAFINPERLGTLFSKLVRIIAPIIYGLVIAYLCNPVYQFCRKTCFAFVSRSKPRPKLQKALSLVATYLFVFFIIAVVFMLVIPQVAVSYRDFQDNVPGYISNVTEWIDRLVQEFPLFDGQYDGLNDFIDKTDLVTAAKDFLTGSYDVLNIATEWVVGFVGRFVVEITNFIIGLIISAYILISREKLLAQIKKTVAALFSESRCKRMTHIAHLTNETFGGYVTGRIMESFIIGLMTLILLAIFRVPYYPLVSVIVAITDLIPFFGPFIGGAVSALIILLADPIKAVIFVVILIVIQQVDANIIGPKILGETTGLGALWVVVSITVMGGLFGVLGMFIGVPTFAVLYVLFKEYVENRLRKKELPASTEDYYPPDTPQNPDHKSPDAD